MAKLVYSDDTGGYPKFRNDRAEPLVRIGAKQFKCIGVSPPDDHPHVYLDMGDGGALICTYCATHYVFDPGLKPDEAFPPECAYRDPPLVAHDNRTPSTELEIRDVPGSAP